MPFTSQYLPFGIGGGSGSPNTLSYSSYSALSSLLANGFQSGTASSTQINTTLRQVSVGVAALAKFAADNGTHNVVDNGVVGDFEIALKSALDALYAPDYTALDARYKQLVGTFTPALSIGGSTAGISYSAQSGRFVRMKNFVFAHSFISLSAKGSATGNLRVTGLPFSCDGNFGCGITVDLCTGLSHPLSALFINGTTSVEPRVFLSTGQGTPATDAVLTNSSTIYTFGCYFTADAMP